MGVTRSTAEDRIRQESRYGRTGQTRDIEFALLLVVSVVVASGVWLVLRARAPELDAAQAGLGSGALLNLHDIKRAADLFPALGFLAEPRDRSFASQRIIEFLRDHESISSAGELRTIRVTSGQVEHTRGLSRFTERLNELRQRNGAAGQVSFPLLTGADFQQMRQHLVVRTPRDFQRQALLYSALFLAAFFLLHIAWRLKRFNGDRLLLPVVCFLSGVGFVMMLRLRDPLRDALLFPDFALGVALGCALAFAAGLPDYERSALRRLAYIPLLASFALSLILFGFGTGPGVSDAKVNLALGPLAFQPVELIKLLLILFLAGYFAVRWEFLRELRESPRRLPALLRSFDVPRLRYAAPLVIAVGAAISFFFLQKDLGPALVITLLFLTLYATARSRVTGSIIACGALVAAVWVGYELKVPRTVANRVSIWLTPWDNFVRPGGDHLAHSVWALATGGTWGTGLGLGEPESIPAVHTDLVLSAVGEELGFAGLFCILLAYAVLIHRGFRIALRARGHYAFFLCFGLTLLIGFQVAFICAGILGLVPLSGVVTPFLNYGKSSALVNFIVLGMIASVSANGSGTEQNLALHKPLRWTSVLLGALGILIVAQAARFQVFSADRFLVRGALVPQADGHRRYAYNIRILEAARSIARGSIFDRNGIPLATSSPELVESYRSQYEQMGINLARVLESDSRRLYPFGALTFHLLGDLTTRLNWGAPNTSFVERDSNTTLQGYDDRAIVVKVRDYPDGPEHTVLRRDYRELIPLVRYRYRPDTKQVQEILERARDVHMTIDARLQVRLADILQKHVRAAGSERGAAVVIDPATGDLLASVTYPRAGVTKALIAGGDATPDVPEVIDSLLDRPRYGVYPPGSSFKLVTAIAALEKGENVQAETFECRRFPDGRVGNFVRGWSRPIRDDILDRNPHGTVDLARGLIVSCNAFFAQLGTYRVGPEPLLKTADFFGIRVASPNTVAQLKDALPQASYGQGQVVASPLQMARVAAAICIGGRVRPVRWLREEDPGLERPALSAEHARTLSGLMRRVVTEGTGREANSGTIPIAGKTGTAELRDRPSHAWFVGFAPSRDSAARRIAFSIIIENGRYGGRVAAPAAPEIVNAAAEAGLIERE
jgi:cell division protein FtsW (lipid II flippase)